MLAGLAALALVPPIALMLQQPFYLDLFTRIMIFAIAALSLDLILGFGGMVSFGHAAYLGIGAYAVGIAGYYGITDGFAHFGIAVLASALTALLIGLVSLRTSGVFFIMITLAFGQMIYFLGLSVNKFGGDDGMTIAEHSRFAGVDLFADPAGLYYFTFCALVLFLCIGFRLVRSRFGMVIRGAKSNERRMGAIGFPTFRYKLCAFVASGAMCGFAGALLANQALFVSPALVHWTRSGEILVMVILGGVGTLFGPILGAVLYLVLEDVLSGVMDYWQLVLGLILLTFVLFVRTGIVGIADWQRRGVRHA